MISVATPVLLDGIVLRLPVYRVLRRPLGGHKTGSKLPWQWLKIYIKKVYRIFFLCRGPGTPEWSEEPWAGESKRVLGGVVGGLVGLGLFQGVPNDLKVFKVFLANP